MQVQEAQVASLTPSTAPKGKVRTHTHVHVHVYLACIGAYVYTITRDFIRLFDT